MTINSLKDHATIIGVIPPQRARLLENKEVESLESASSVSFAAASYDYIEFGTLANETLTGGVGNDLLVGGGGHDSLSGGDGHDTLDVLAREDEGYDEIDGDTLSGGAGDDTLNGGMASDFLDGGVGNDVIYANGGFDTVVGGDGDDYIAGGNFYTGGSDTQADVLDGGVGNDSIFGGDGADTINGAIGNDLIEGGIGNDLIEGGTGSDTMLGGDGADTYSVQDTGDTVTETNTSTGASESDLVLSYVADYTLTANVEQGRIMNASAANLTGNTLDNTLFAGTGNNVLAGAAGLDTVSYALGAASGVSVSLAVATAQVTGGSGSDTLSGIENLIGTAFIDKLTGSAGANALSGGAGADSLYGGLGNDTMSGGDGADNYSVQDAGDVIIETNTTVSAAESDLVYSYLASYTLTDNVEQGRLMNAGAANLTGNAMNNSLFAGTGANVINGMAGTDTVSYAHGAISGVTLSLAVATAQVTGGSGADTLLGIENLVGSAFADNLTGTSGANALTGGAGNDMLDGGTGNDTMNGNDGADTYHVRDAADVVSETNTSSAATESDLVLSYLASYTLGSNVEQGRVMLGSAANLTGNALNNVLYAAAGNNVFNGAAGLDTASYALATSAVSVSLAVTTAQATGGSGSDSLSAIENLIGSDYADKLTGTSLANALTGGLGNDSLYGGYGSDTMSGGDGADVYSVQDAGDVVIETNATVSAAQRDQLFSYLASYTLGANIEQGTIMSTTAASLSGNSMDNMLFAGKGDNVISGAAGLDTVSYATGAVSAVTLSLAVATAQATGGSGSDTLVDIENLIGTAYADKLTGSTGANALGGGAGNDSLYGGFGTDTMTGGDGADTYSVQDLTDVIVETNSSTASTESDFAYSYVAAYTLSANIEQGRIMNTTAANLAGNAAANTLFAGTGNNVLNGAAGTDTVSYAFGAASAVTVSLAVAGSQATGGSGSDTLTLVENLIGTSFADQLTGDGLANALTGGAGNDTLDGGIGNDVLTGGAGLDVLTGGAGNDIFAYASAGDTGAAAGTRDTIADLVQGQDKIDLSLIDANTATVANEAFTAMLGSADAFTAAGQLRITDGVLYINTDADADAEFAIELTGVVALAIGDFIA